MKRVRRADVPLADQAGQLVAQVAASGNGQLPENGKARA